MNALVLLPFAPFELADLERLIECVEKRFKKPNIVLYCHSLSFEYYCRKYPDKQFKIMIDSKNMFNYLTREIVYRNCKEYIDSDNYVVVVANNESLKISAKPLLSEHLPIYRWMIITGLIKAEDASIDVFGDPEADSNIFGRINKTQRTGTITLLPFGYMVRMHEYGYINEFGFRVPKNYRQLKNRDKNHKLICAFGGSCCYSCTVYDDEMWTKVLEERLNNFAEQQGLKTKYTVLNFGMLGNLVLDQLQTYIMFAYELNPDAVISYDGFNDIVAGIRDDAYLMENFNYGYWFHYEYWSKILAASPEKIVWQQQETYVNHKNSPKVVAMSYYNRKKQFEKMVNEAGAEFFSVFQPAYYSKKENSDREKIGYDFQHDAAMANDMPYVKIMHEKINHFMDELPPFKNHLNLYNEFASFGKEVTLFADVAHTTKAGDELISAFIFEQIKKWVLNNE